MAFRTIDTDIWSNAWFYDLKPAQKVMYIFLFSNSMVSNIGVLEVSRKQFASTTGVSLPTANKFLAELEEDGQVVVDGRLILLTKFIAKQTHFGGKDTEANKNDNLVKNLRNLWAACPSEKFKRILQETYPNLFAETQESSDEKASPYQAPSNPLPTEKEAPSKTLGSPYQDPYKPLGSEREGSGGDIGEYRDKGDLSIPPLYPPKGGTPDANAPAGVSTQEEKPAAQEQPAPSPQPEAQPEQPTLSPEQPAKPKRKRTDYRRDDMQVVWNRLPVQEDEETFKKTWEKGCREGWIPDLETIMAALDWQIPMWAQRDPRYVPGPVTYLRKRKWNDKPRVPAQPQQHAFSGQGYNRQPKSNSPMENGMRTWNNLQNNYDYYVEQGIVEGDPSRNNTEIINTDIVQQPQLPNLNM